MTRTVLAFDTATDTLAIGLGSRSGETTEVLRSVCEESPRKANTVLLARVAAELEATGRTAADVSEVVVGCGPGSFTGVRIGVASAKGLAVGLGVPLYGVGTLDAVAWRAVLAAGAGDGSIIGVVGDAMRGEVYPALFRVDRGHPVRLGADRVARPQAVGEAWAQLPVAEVLLVGNGLRKYADDFVDALGDRAVLLPETAWVPDGASLLAAYSDARARGETGPGDPAVVLPIYTRLSDAEEAERDRTGPVVAARSVWDVERPDPIRTRPMLPTDVETVMPIETDSFSEPWTPGIFLDELRAPRRAWIVAEQDGEVIGYGGIAALGDEAHLMNLAVREDRRGRGAGRRLLERLMQLAPELGPELMTLEVRPSNAAAIALYESCGFSLSGRRRRYYADTGEDALIMSGRAPKARSVTRPGRCLELPGQTGRDTADLVVLAIETSCDETAAAVMRGSDRIVADVVASQVDFHARFGGVVPEIASRKHTEAIVGVVDEAMERAGRALGCGGPLPYASLDAIAVTRGPGLVGALVTGLAFAKGLSYGTGVPLVGANHLEGHIFANVLADPEIGPPLIALVVSGGHTSLVHMPKWGEYHTLGETLDDAAGEAFDKVAKALGLGYPGGPILSKLAEDGDPEAVAFPRAMLHSGDYRFSLSGLKTAVINYIRHEREAGREIDLPDLAASFQAAVVDVQVAKAVRAVEETGATSFCLAGGVAANPVLREALRAAIEPLGVRVSVPPFSLCTDNAAMIAAAAHYRYLAGERLDLTADADPGLRLDSPE